MSIRGLFEKSTGCGTTEGNTDSDKPTRLGRRALGWFAHEQQMPNRLFEVHGVERVEHGISGIVKVLQDSCHNDSSIETAYFCHPSVQYIGKLKGEGSFCGYRNIQMLISYILYAHAPGCRSFPEGIPSVLRIQDFVEDAWDNGINSEGRIETGGIRGTRKHIGTPEAQAIFKSLDIGCRVATHNDTPNGTRAFEKLISFVKEYFSAAANNSEPDTHQTNLPPIYLQRPRHSLTIVGWMSKNDSASLIVFNPATRPSAEMQRGENGSKPRAMPASYMLGKKQLAGYKTFETLILTDVVP